MLAHRRKQPEDSSSEHKIVASEIGTSDGEITEPRVFPHEKESGSRPRLGHRII
jgi:hypothetical protein